MIFVAEVCTPTLIRLSVRHVVLATTVTWKVCRRSTTARSVQQAHTRLLLVSTVTTVATSALLARGPILLVRAAGVKTAPLTRPTVNPSERPHVRTALKAITPKQTLVPRHAKHVQLANNRREPLDRDRAHNVKKVTSAVRE